MDTKLESISFTVDEFSRICKDTCEYIKQNRVGSTSCTEGCEYGFGINEEKGYVLCGFKSKTKKSKENSLKIYIAGALFTIAEQQFNTAFSIQLQNSMTNIFIHLPQDACKGLETPQEIYENCVNGIDDCDLVIAILEGCDVDSGTAFEMGYATKSKKPIIGIRSDFRSRGDDFSNGLNCMLSKSLYHLIQQTTIYDTMQEIIPLLQSMREDLYS